MPWCRVRRYNTGKESNAAEKGVKSMDEPKNTLIVKTFGSFSAKWNGNVLFDDTISGETQFICLMQILLHHRREGVDRARLLEELFYDRDVQDAAHSMSVLFYNTQRRLRTMGLPAGSCFERSNGRIYWTSAIPVLEDTDCFETLCRKADAAPDKELALPLYLEAAGRFSGDFLPNRAGSLWVSHEARRYREMFGACLRKAAAMLRERRDYGRLEELGRHASRVQPYADWERLTLEALIAQGRAEEAKKLYNETEQRYFQELKLRPDRQMSELKSRIEELAPPDHTSLDELMEQLSAGSPREEGAFFCRYSTFESICQAAQRLTQRGRYTACLMLCTLEKSAGTSEAQGDALKTALCAALRRSDVVCRYGQTQFLVLLADMAPTACAAVRERISARLSPALRAAVRCDVMPL